MILYTADNRVINMNYSAITGIFPNGPLQHYPEVSKNNESIKRFLYQDIKNKSKKLHLHNMKMLSKVSSQNWLIIEISIFAANKNFSLCITCEDLEGFTFSTRPGFASWRISQSFCVKNKFLITSFKMVRRGYPEKSS